MKVLNLENVGAHARGINTTLTNWSTYWSNAYNMLKVTQTLILELDYWGYCTIEEWSQYTLVALRKEEHKVEPDLQAHEHEWLQVGQSAQMEVTIQLKNIQGIYQQIQQMQGKYDFHLVKLQDAFVPNKLDYLVEMKKMLSQ